MISKSCFFTYRALPFLFGLVVVTSGFAGVSSAQMVVAKRCGACGASVSLAASVGGACPYCGATWTHSEHSYSTSSSGYGSSYEPTPYDVWCYWSMVRQQQQLLKKQQYLQRMQERAGVFRELKKKEETRRKRYQEQAIAEASQAPRVDDPEQRAGRLLASGRSAESNGRCNVAVAYYKIAVRIAPGTTAGYEALNRLEELGVN